MIDPNSQDSYTRAYNAWVVNRTPENMANLVEAFMPTVNAELAQYAGPKDTMRSRARAYVINAIKSFNPMGSTKLRTWVVTNLKQLSRYSKGLRSVHASEDMVRNSAELARTEAEMEDRLGRRPTIEELTDETGWSAKTIDKIRGAAPAYVSEGQMAPDDEDSDEGASPAVVRPSKLPLASEAVYMGLDDRDKAIFDHKTGMHGKDMMSGKQLADLLKITPAAVSQRASAIGSAISDYAGGEG